MSVTHRLFSALICATSLAACGAPTNVQAPTPAAPTLAPVEIASLVSGPMLGYVTHREVAVWVQTTGPAEVVLHYWPTEAPEQVSVSTPVHTNNATWFTATLLATLLEPGTEYTYMVTVDGALFPAAGPATFSTQPLWQWRTDPPPFSVAFGSCMYINEERFDRPGTPYGSSYGIFDHIAGLSPDLMLWLGDNVYFREVDWDSRTSMAHRYTHDRATPELQRLLASTHHLAVWDDHDYGPNDADRSYVGKLDALDLFESFWANPSYGFDGPDGIFTRYTYHDIDFFLLDTRFWRAPRDAPDDATKTLLGDEQLQWLIDALTASRSPFKVIVTSSQFVNEAAHYETWARYSHERQVVLDAIVQRRIPGVLFLSGDRHHGELLRYVPEGGYPLYDFTSSPLTAGLGDARYELENPLRVDGTLILGVRNFGHLRFEGPRTDRSVVLEARDEAGALLWSHTIRASELTFTEAP